MTTLHVLQRRTERAREWRRSVVIVPGLIGLVIDGGARLAAHSAGRIAAAAGRDPYPHAWHGYEMLPPLYIVIGLGAAGAVAAWLSQRRGGRVVHRIVASVFPAALSALVLGIAVFLELSSGGALPSGSMQTLVGWICVGGAASMLGASPFLIRRGSAYGPLP